MNFGKIKVLTFLVIGLFFGAGIVQSGYTKDLNNIYTLYVDDDAYPGGDGSLTHPFQDIQDAITAAYPGYRIFVFNGQYPENVVVDLSVNLVGESKHSTMVNGCWEGNTICVTSKNVYINGFTIIHGESGIKIENNNCHITDNIIDNNDIGIFISESNNNFITDNSITSNTQGIFLESARNNVLSNNTLNDNDEGIRTKYAECYGNMICGNLVMSNEDYGIFLGKGEQYILSDNTISFNKYGLYVDVVRESFIYNNTITECDTGIILYRLASNISTYHNNFKNNFYQAKDFSSNSWDEGPDIGGNYWDDYEGLDEDSNGIGDSPYMIYGGSQDNYPYIDENGWISLTAEPYLVCQGSLNWNDVHLGEQVTGSFSLCNQGEVGSLLNWEILEFPEWGSWSFEPSFGTNLCPEDGVVLIEVSVIAPDEKQQKFNGSIQIINSDNFSNFCEIPISLTTSRDKERQTTCNGHNEDALLTNFFTCKWVDNCYNHDLKLDHLLSRNMFMLRWRILQIFGMKLAGFHLNG